MHKPGDSGPWAGGSAGCSLPPLASCSGRTVITNEYLLSVYRGRGCAKCSAHGISFNPPKTLCSSSHNRLILWMRKHSNDWRAEPGKQGGSVAIQPLRVAHLPQVGSALQGQAGGMCGAGVEAADCTTLSKASGLQSHAGMQRQAPGVTRTLNFPRECGK